MLSEQVEDTSLAGTWLPCDYFMGTPPPPKCSIMRAKGRATIHVDIGLVLICALHSLFVWTTAFCCGATEAQVRLWRQWGWVTGLGPSGSASCCLGWGRGLASHYLLCLHFAIILVARRLFFLLQPDSPQPVQSQQCPDLLLTDSESQQRGSNQ